MLSSFCHGSGIRIITANGSGIPDDEEQDEEDQ